MTTERDEAWKVETLNALMRGGPAIGHIYWATWWSLTMNDRTALRDAGLIDMSDNGPKLTEEAIRLMYGEGSGS